MAIQNAINLTASGIVAHDGSGTFAGRTITGTTDFIDVADGSGVSGNPTASIASNFEDTGMHSWNGTFIQKATTTVTSDGATITLDIQRSGGGDLTIVFSDGYYAYDTTPADTVTLTAGSDTSPQINYVYILQSTKALTVSTTSFPATECARVATVLCQSAASLQTDGAYKHHQWTDDVKESNEQGHLTDLSLWIREQPATWLNGVVQSYNITTNVGTPDNVLLTTTSGNALQLHDNDFPAFSGTPDIYVINDSATPYNIVTDLNALLTDSTGASMSGRYFSLVIWGAVNQESGDCKLFCNLPSGSYGNSSNLTSDSSKYANYEIPNSFRGVGFLISQWNLRHQTSSGGTWTSIDEIDLRGIFPSISAGGSNSFPTEFADNTFKIFDETDTTKEIAFQASGVATATTRTITMPDKNVNLATATTTNEGIVSELATDAEAIAKTDTSRVITPSNLAALTPSETASGLAEIATQAEVTTGTDDLRYMTPLKHVTSFASPPPIGSTTPATELHVDTMSFDGDDITTSGDGIAIKIAENGYYSNLDITYSSSTLSVTGITGTALSATNKGYVGMTSVTTGQTVVVPVVANQGFIDSTGSSEITNNLFGLPTGVAFTSDVPFYGYAVLNDAETAVAFMLSRTPGMTTSPAVGEIGAPDDAVADEQFSFFSLDNIDETLYDTNPCIMLFSIRMTMDSSDDWAVSALSDQDGFGKFQENILFDVPVATFGAGTNSHFLANGGTAPIFTVSEYKYMNDVKEGVCNVFFNTTTVSSAGIGSVSLQLLLPYTVDDFGVGSEIALGGGYWDDNSLSKKNICSSRTAGSQLFCYTSYVSDTAAGRNILNNFLGSNDTFNVNIKFKIANS